MNRIQVCLAIGVCLFACVCANAQTEGSQSVASEPDSAGASSTVTVPRLIRIKGTIAGDFNNSSLPSAVPVTFRLYKDQGSVDPLWQETQNVELDVSGNYTALLGATEEAGLPLQVFTSGEAHWLGVQPDGRSEAPRILLLSVAYALKAADAETLGGFPASAFLLANGVPSAAGSQALKSAPFMAGSSFLTSAPAGSCAALTSDGSATTNQIAKFTGACNIENSAIFESGGKVGIGNTSPAGALDVSGTAFVRGSLTTAGTVLSPSGTATTSTAFVSNPFDIQSSVYNTTVIGPVNYTFRLQAEPSGNDTTNTGATLNVLYGVAGSMSETGLSIDRNGLLTFAKGQTFPGVSGTVTSVNTGAGLTGGPITTSGTINIPSAGVSNTMLANSAVTVKAGTGLSGGGTVSLGGTITLANAGITGVTAGSGLTGGGSTGAVSLSLLQTCSTGQVLAWSGTTWVCTTIGGGISGSGATNGIAYFSAPTTVASTSAPSNGQLLVGSTGKAPVLTTLTAGANITITNGPGAITIAGAGGNSTPLPFFVTAGGRIGNAISFASNLNKLWGFLLPYGVTTTQVTYDARVADNTPNLYDLGVFNSSGTLLLDIGPVAGTTFAPSTGFKTLAWTQGSTSLPAGKYYLGLTSNCGTKCAQLQGGDYWVSFAVDLSAGATSGGALSSSITPPADTWNDGTQPTVVIR